MTSIAPIAFLLDVDDTLLDGDQFVADLKTRTTEVLGAPGAKHFWEILEVLRGELGYVDYLGTLQRYRVDHPHDQRSQHIATFLLAYPFAERLYPDVLRVIERLRTWGPTAILSDGDAVFQPHKIDRSGLQTAFSSNVLIYVHKERELADIESHYPADHYVMVDDKLEILTAVKQAWRSRVTTVFPRQGHYAHDPAILARCPPADITLDSIAELFQYDLPELLKAGQADGSGSASISSEGPRQRC